MKPADTILIADDSALNIEVLTKILKPQYNLLTARSGKETLLLAQEKQPDLILLDIVMPEMDGFQALESLKRMPETQNIPVIFITGLDSCEDEERGLFLGASDYIKKPFHNSIVLARIKTQMDMLRYIRTIEQMGMIDALTGIPNRRYFENQINIEWNRAVRQGSAISILMLDIDHFKKYNDTFGHPQGDQILKDVAQLLASNLRRATDLAARYGGEEFAAILPATSREDATALAQCLCDAIAKHEFLLPEKGERIHVTISIGVAGCMPQLGDNMLMMLSRADEALYQAKASGRNRVCVWSAF